MKFGYILDAVNKAISVSNLFGTKAGNHSTIDGMPLGTAGNATTGEVLLKVSVREDMSETVGGVVRTPVVTTVTTNGTVAAGKKYIEMILSTDFAGTIDGETFSGTNDAVYSIPLLMGADTYAALSYTISAGNARITTF